MNRPALQSRPARGRLCRRMKGSSLEWFAYFTLMVNVSVLLHPLVLVYAATYESVPIVSGMLLIWREVDV